MMIRLYTKTVVWMVLVVMFLSGCSFYVPNRGSVIIEVRDHEAAANCRIMPGFFGLVRC